MQSVVFLQFFKKKGNNTYIVPFSTKLRYLSFFTTWNLRVASILKNSQNVCMIDALVDCWILRDPPIKYVGAFIMW